MTTTKTNPADYARSHWRQYETPADHAERVERAEHTAGRYFEQATVRQKAAYDLAMADLRGLSAPRYDRARKAANAAWHRDTEEARILFNETAAEIMRDGEVSEELSGVWDELCARSAQVTEAA